MDLFELQDLLVKYRNGTCTPGEKQLVEAWLQHEDPVSFSWQPGERQAVEAQLLERLRAATLPAVRPLWKRALPRVAAIFFLLAGVSMIAYRFLSPKPKVPVPLIVIASGPHEIRHILLPDGSTVVLAPGSRLSFPARSDGSVREAALSGTGYFDVSRLESHPFIVHAGKVDVRVLGTSFLVKDLPGDSLANVSVVTGKVQVSHGDRILAVLLRNKAMNFNSSSQQSALEDVNAEAAISWIDQRLVFRETPLDEVLHTLEQTYHFTIQAQPGTLRHKAFTGAFTARDSLTDVLDILCIPTGLSYRKINDSTIRID